MIAGINRLTIFAASGHELPPSSVATLQDGELQSAGCVAEGYDKDLKLKVPRNSRSLDKRILVSAFKFLRA